MPPKSNELLYCSLCNISISTKAAYTHVFSVEQLNRSQGAKQLYSNLQTLFDGVFPIGEERLTFCQAHVRSIDTCAKAYKKVGA